jgi:hypothetical protein
MVIGIPGPGKGTAGRSRGVSAASARPFRPTYSNRLLRRRSFFLRSVGSGVRGVGSGVSAGSGSVGSSSACIGGSAGSGIARRISGITRSGSGVRGSSLGGSGSVGSGVGGLFLFGATGAQHEGNRNGAPDLCIHRQLPQYVSESYESTFATGTAQFVALQPCRVREF